MMAASSEHPGRPRLLLLEQDRHIIDNLRDMFPGSEFECEMALDVQTALEIVLARHMDVVVVDSAISPAPAGGIRGLIRRIKAESPATRVVVFNGVTDKAVQRKMRRLGAYGYVSRASDLRAVERSVRRVLAL